MEVANVMVAIRLEYMYPLVVEEDDNKISFTHDSMHCLIQSDMC